MKSTNTPRVPALYAPTNIFQLEVTVGVIPTLEVVEVLVTDTRFRYTPAAGAERMPVTASLSVDDPDSLLIVNITIVNEATGQIRIRFFNCNAVNTDFNDRILTFYVWPLVADP